MSRTTSEKVIQVLNAVLTAELTAINQYFVHAEMMANWGYTGLHDKVRLEAIDEMKHAEALIERVLYLNGIPNVQRLDKINIGENVHEMLKSDYALEEIALTRLNDGITLCRAEKDEGSRQLLDTILAAEEQHVDWIESQLDQIEQMGLQNYLAANAR